MPLFSRHSHVRTILDRARGERSQPTIAPAAPVADGRWRVVVRSARNGRVLRVIAEEITVHAEAVRLAAVRHGDAVTIAVEAQHGRRRNRSRETQQRAKRHQAEKERRGRGIGYEPLPAHDGGGSSYPAGVRRSYSSTMRASDHQPHVSSAPTLHLDPAIMHRFNAYACAAMPNEIGGLLRVEGTPREGYRITDMKIFPHITASGAYFELDGVEVAKFLGSIMRESRALKAEGKLDEAEAKKAEIGQWRSLIHSHPKMSSFMSGTDKENVERLAGGSHAFSVIVSAWENPERNWVTVHYAQVQPLPLTIANLAPATDLGATLAGLGDLTEDEIAAIRADCEACGIHKHTIRFVGPAQGGYAPQAQPRYRKFGEDTYGDDDFAVWEREEYERPLPTLDGDRNLTTREIALPPMRSRFAAPGSHVVRLPATEKGLLRREIGWAASGLSASSARAMRAVARTACEGKPLSDADRAWLRDKLIERAAVIGERAAVIGEGGTAVKVADSLRLMALADRFDPENTPAADTEPTPAPVRCTLTESQQELLRKLVEDASAHLDASSERRLVEIAERVCAGRWAATVERERLLRTINNRLAAQTGEDESALIADLTALADYFENYATPATSVPAATRTPSRRTNTAPRQNAWHSDGATIRLDPETLVVLRSELALCAPHMAKTTAKRARSQVRRIVEGKPVTDANRIFLQHVVYDWACDANLEGRGLVYEQQAVIDARKLRVDALHEIASRLCYRASAAADPKHALRRATLPFGTIEQRIVGEALSYLAEQAANEAARNVYEGWQTALDARHDLWVISDRAVFATELGRYLAVLDAAGNRRDKIVLERLIAQLGQFTGGQQQGPSGQQASANPYPGMSGQQTNGSGVRVFADDVLEVDEFDDQTTEIDEAFPFSVDHFERPLVLEAITWALEDADRAETHALHDLRMDIEANEDVLGSDQLILLRDLLDDFAAALDDQGREDERQIVVALFDQLDIGLGPA